MMRGIVVHPDPGVDEDSEAVLGLRRRIQESTASLPEGVGTISLALAPDQEARAESYRIVIHEGGVNVTAPDSAGIFYAAQTLGQLFSGDGPEVWSAELPAMVIEDAPAFQYRGLLLDVSRHFFPAEDVKKLIGTMAAFKFNRFHWHLTDDQGWRLPVRQYPELTRKGAGPRFKGNQLADSGRRFEGAYTEQEIRDVVAFAQKLHVEVIPEIDVPGHVAAAIAAYPELGNIDFKPPSGPISEWGVQDWTLAPTKASVDFLEAVFATVVDLFPSKYIHVGGDEAPTKQWLSSSDSAKSQWDPVAFEGPNPQSFFNKKVSEILRSHGRHMAGWDEVQSIEGLPKDTVIFAWRSEDELRKAVKNGRHVVNANIKCLYLDHYQGPPHSEPRAIGTAVNSLEDVYAFELVPSSVAEHDRHLVLGAQAQLWSEYLPTWTQVEYMAFPRALALAERLWTPKESVSEFVEFRRRLQMRLPDLERRGVEYRPLDGPKPTWSNQT